MALGMLIPFVAAQAQMALPSSAGVAPSGAATYQVPLQLPPGVAGMTPKLAFTYNSQAGNGLMGWGWTLDGLSAITRCPQTMVHDGARGSINFDANDRFCLDGQRLILVSGVYGADGSEYRTELESFSRIVARGAAGNGPAYFSVQTKSGLAMQYGFTADSRIEAVNANPSVATVWPASTVRVWAQNTVADAAGNWYGIAYTKNSSNGEYYPASISYAGNTINFEMADRYDTEKLYHAGAIISTTKRLNAVSIANNGAIYRYYSLNYKDDVGPNEFLSNQSLGGYPYRTRLGAISSNGNDIQFTWPVDGPDLTVPSAVPAVQSSDVGGTNVYNSAKYMQVGDFNGDGKSDFMWIPAGQTYWNLAVSTGSGFNVTQNILPSSIGGYPSYNGGAAYKFGDFNGDGKLDYMWVPNGASHWNIAYSNGTGFDVTYQVIPANVGGYVPYNVDSKYMIWGDFNGDGKLDYMWIPQGQQFWNIAYSTGTGFTLAGDVIKTSNGDLPYSNGAQYMMVGDFNGDGKTDFMWMPQGKTYFNIAYGTTTGFNVVEKVLQTASDGTLPYNNGAQYMMTGDFNGDGKTDYMWIPQGQLYWNLALSTGNGFNVINNALPATLLNELPYNNSPMYMKVGDFNGDGKLDFMWIPNGGQKWHVAYSTGYGFQVERNAINWCCGAEYGGAAHYMLTGDFDGDGKTDYMWIPNGQTFWNIAYGRVNGFSILTRALAESINGYFPYNGNPDYVLLGDFNGDGKPDYMWIPNGVTFWYVSMSKSQRMLMGSAQNNLGAQVVFSYKPLTDPSVYVKDTGVDAAVYPVVDLAPPVYAVDQLAKSNGLGGLNSTYFGYGGLKAEVGSGRGSLGFRWMTSSETSTGVNTYSEYAQLWPYTGMPVLSETRLSAPLTPISLKSAVSSIVNAKLLKRTNTVYSCNTPTNAQACVNAPSSSGMVWSTAASNNNLVYGTAQPGARYFVYASSQTEKSWDRNGAEMPSITTTTQYGINTGDDQMWGDPSRIDVVTSFADKSQTKTTINEYWPAQTGNGQWITGRLKRASVTSSLQQ